MIEIKLTEKMKDWARGKTDEQIETEGFINEIDTHESVYIGYLGEAAWWKNNPKAVHADSRDYDFKLNGNYYDIKSYWTQFRPRPGYTAIIPAKNLVRGKGFYCITAVMSESDTSFLIGEIPCTKFREIASFRAENEEKQGRAGHFLCDCYEVNLNELNPYNEESFSDRPYPEPRPGNCLACESMGGWKPYTNISMYCFYSAKVLKVARPPVICTEAVVNCPLIIENLI